MRKLGGVGWGNFSPRAARRLSEEITARPSNKQTDVRPKSGLEPRSTRRREPGSMMRYWNDDGRDNFFLFCWRREREEEGKKRRIGRLMGEGKRQSIHALGSGVEKAAGGGCGLRKLRMWVPASPPAGWVGRTVRAWWGHPCGKYRKYHPCRAVSAQSLGARD